MCVCQPAADVEWDVGLTNMLTLADAVATNASFASELASVDYHGDGMGRSRSRGNMSSLKILAKEKKWVTKGMFCSGGDGYDFGGRDLGCVCGRVCYARFLRFIPTQRGRSESGIGYVFKYPWAG